MRQPDANRIGYYIKIPACKWHCLTSLPAVETKQSNLLDQKKILEEIQEIKQAVVANAPDIKGFSHTNQDIGSTGQRAAPSLDFVCKRLRFKGVTGSTSKKPFQRQMDELHGAC